MDVVIVGGGSAGIGAAYALLGAGVKVTLIEAQDRLGGRAMTDRSQGFSFDKGPQYLQDPKDNPWVKIANDLGFNLLEDPDLKTLYRMNVSGGWQDQDGEESGVQKGYDTIHDNFDKAIAKPNARTLGGPLGSDAASLIAQMSDFLGPVAESAELWQYIARDNARQDEGSGGVAFVKEGVGTLVQAWGAKLIDNTSYTQKLGTVVREIVVENSKVTVRCADDTEVVADACIVTVPVSVLGEIVFKPALPGRHTTALKYLRLGSYKKVAFRPKKMPDDIAENTEYYITAADLGPRGCWEYFRLPTWPEVIIGVAAGDYARHLDDVPDSEVAGFFIDRLSQAYSVRLEPREPPLVTNWTGQRGVKGAYSYTAYAPDLSEDDDTPLEARITLAEPVAGGRVRYAGEATYTAAYGTLHGAYLAGEQAARALVKQLPAVPH